MPDQYTERVGALVCRSRCGHAPVPLVGRCGRYREYGNRRSAQTGIHEGVLAHNNIRAERAYPPILITTKTSDDRVQPGHCCKMAAAALQSEGHRVLFYENTDGGHQVSPIKSDKAAFQTA